MSRFLSLFSPGSVPAINRVGRKHAADALGRLRMASLGLLLFAIGLMVEAAGIALWQGSFPNYLVIPPLTHASLWPVLWESNPLHMILYLVQTESWLLIESRQGGAGGQIWGLYYPLPSFLVHVLAAGLGTRLLMRPEPHCPRRHLRLILAGLCLLLLSAAEIQLAVCCTSGSDWIVQVILKSLALEQTGQMVNWRALYPQLEPWFVGLRTLLALGGAGLLLLATLRRR